MPTKKTTTQSSEVNASSTKTSEAKNDNEEVARVESTGMNSTDTDSTKANFECKENSTCKESGREYECINAINQNVLFATAAGLIPYPGLDIAAITGVQLKLVADLSKIYGVKFNKELAASLIFGVLGSSGAVTIGRGVAGSILKSIPFVGTAAGLVVVPATAGATTYAVGRLFVEHFETGGTLLNFNAEKAREHYDALFQQGKEVVESLKDRLPPLLGRDKSVPTDLENQ